MEVLEKEEVVKSRRKADLGSFKVESGKLVVTDPCYDDEVKDGRNIVKNVRNGEWVASIGTHENSALNPVSLTAKHSKGQAVTPWIELPFTVGVDSGQTCIFDTAHFGQDTEALGKEAVEWGDHHSWFYKACCFLTLGRATKVVGKHSFTESETDPNFVAGGVLHHGAVSSTYHGDGEYKAFVKKDKNGKVVAVRIDHKGNSGW